MGIKYPVSVDWTWAEIVDADDENIGIEYVARTLNDHATKYKTAVDGLQMIRKHLDTVIGGGVLLIPVGIIANKTLKALGEPYNEDGADKKGAK